MNFHRVCNVALWAMLCVAAAPANVGAATYQMTVQSVPQAGSKCVSLPNGQFADGMRVLIWDCNGFLNQNLTYDDQSQQLKVGGNCVEVIGQGNAQDAVGVGACNNSVTQRWSMAPVAGNYQILGVNSLCLDIADGIVANGTPLQLYGCAADNAAEQWVLLQASSSPAANQNGNAPGQATNASGPGNNGTGQPGGTPGQQASNTPGGGSGPGGSSSGPGGGGPGPGGGGSGPGGGYGPGMPGGGSGLPGPVTILVGLLNPPGYGGMDPGQPMYPGQPMDPGQMAPGMTPTSGSPPMTGQMCGLDPSGQLVQVNLSIPTDPNATVENGQYCVSGGPDDGKCGTVTVDKSAQTMQVCGNGVCTPALPPDPSNLQTAGYSQTLFGIPDGSPDVPCTGTFPPTDTTAGLGPPMDIAFPAKKGKPLYASLPQRVPGASYGNTGPQTITIVLPKPPASCNPNTCKQCAASPPPPAPPPKLSPGPTAAACNPNTCKQCPAPPPKGAAPVLKPQVASAGSSAVPSCDPKPVMPSWGGTSPSTMTVSGGGSCSIGWDSRTGVVPVSMSASKPSCGSVQVQGIHAIYTPGPDCKEQATFSVTIQEQYQGKSATAHSNVTVTIK